MSTHRNAGLLVGSTALHCTVDTQQLELIDRVKWSGMAGEPLDLVLARNIVPKMATLVRVACLIGLALVGGQTSWPTPSAPGATLEAESPRAPSCEPCLKPCYAISKITRLLAKGEFLHSS